MIDESTRHALHERLYAVLGREEAVTLMAHLPPVGWADVATKHDLDHLAVTVKLTIQASADGLRAEFYKSQTAQTRTLVSWMIGAIVTVAGLAFGAAQLG